jgi:hypothetical protein
MAEDPSNTKPDLYPLDRADWVSAIELGDNITQINCGAWVLAYVDIQTALAGGCGAVLELEQNGQKSYAIPPPGFWLPPDRLRWVNGLNPAMRREDYPDRPWPWELCAYLLPSERGGFDATARIFLRRAEAAQWGLPLESPQAVASEESPSPDKQLNDPAVGVQASVHAQSAPEQSEMPPPKPPESDRAESTEQLTYAQIADRLGRSPDAARTLVARRGLPRARGSDGKILVTINFQELHYQPQSARSPGGHRAMTGRSPGGHHPVAKPEAAALPPVDAMTTEAAAPATESDLDKPTPEATSADAFQQAACETNPRCQVRLTHPAAEEP